MSQKLGLKDKLNSFIFKNSIAEFVVWEKVTTESIPERWDLVGPEVPADLYTHARRRSKPQEKKLAGGFPRVSFAAVNPLTETGFFFGVAG